MVREAENSVPASLIQRFRDLLSWRRIFGASGILISTTMLTNILRVANTMVLTRLLAPADFGLIGIILSTFLVVSMVTDAGFEAFIVRHERGDEPAFLHSVWTLHVLRGVANAIVIAMLAAPISSILGKPQLTPLLAVASITLAIDGTASLSLLTSLRRNLVKRLSMLDFSIFLTQLVTGLISAWFLRNAWAIILSMILASATRSLMSYLIFPDSGQRPILNRAVGRELWRFSRIIALSSTLTLVINQLDKFILARFFSLAQFGVYAVAANLAAAPVSLAFSYTSRIFYPAYAAQWRADPGGMPKVFRDTRGFFFRFYLFATGGLVGVAPLLIRVLYDPRYLGAGRFLAILGVSTILALPNRAMAEMFNAIGRTSGHLVMNMIRLGWLLLVGIGGFVALGPIGLIFTLGLIEVPAYLYALYRLRRLGIATLRGEIGPLAVIAAGICLGVLSSVAGDHLFTWMRAAR